MNGLLKPCDRTNWRWSSGTWSKASERATVRLDQVGTRVVYRFRLPIEWTSNLLVSSRAKYNQLRILLDMYSAAPLGGGRGRAELQNCFVGHQLDHQGARLPQIRRHRRIV